MQKLEKQVLELLVLPKTLAERKHNISILQRSNTFLASEDEHIWKSNESIPRFVEQYLVVDFERKRSMITEILFDLHKYHPDIFPIQSYLDVTKKVFATVTKYRWSGEDAGIIIRLIVIHIQDILDKISKEFIIMTFQKHDATLFFTTEEIKEILQSCKDEYDIPHHEKCIIHHTVLDSIEDVRYIQKVFRKNFHYFSGLFGEEILTKFLAEDVDTIVHHEEMTHTYIEIFREILIRKINTINITSNRKIEYQKGIIEEANLRAILFWSDHILKHQNPITR